MTAYYSESHENFLFPMTKCVGPDNRNTTVQLFAGKEAYDA